MINAISVMIKMNFIHHLIWRLLAKSSQQQKIQLMHLHEYLVKYTFKKIFHFSWRYFRQAYANGLCILIGH